MRTCLDVAVHLSWCVLVLTLAWGLRAISNSPSTLFLSFLPPTWSLQQTGLWCYQWPFFPLQHTMSLSPASQSQFFLLLFVCLCFLSIPLASVLPPPLPMSSSSLLLSPPSCSPLLSHSIPLTFFLHPASTCSWCYSFSRPFNNPWCLFVHAGVCTRTFLYFCFYSICLYYASTSVHVCVVNLEREGC